LCFSKKERAINADKLNVGKEYLYRALAFVAPLSLYILTAAPSLYWEDSAGFQLAAVELGIAHNPSFPLYVLIARLLTLLPFGSAAFMVNLASALFGAAAAFMVYLLARDLAYKVGKPSDWVPSLALLAAMLFATVESVWLQAVRAEVYTLNAFLTFLFLWLALRFVQQRLTTVRFAAFAGLVIGLGLANHPLLLGVVALPVLAVLFWWQREKLLAVRPIMLVATFLAIGLSVYLYLPIRAVQMPTLNWGDFTSIGGTLRSLLRLEEALPIATAGVTTPFLERLWSNLIHFFNSLGGLVILFGAAGLVCLWRQNRWLALVFFLPWLMSILTTAYAADFSRYNLDLGGYLLPAFAAVVILIPLWPTAIGRSLTNFMQNRTWLRLTWTAPFCAVLLLALIMQTSASLRHADKHDLMATSTYAEQLLCSVPEQSIIIAGEDNTFLPLLALQGLQQLRADVAVISGGALLRTDYRNKVKNRFPEFWYPADWQERSFANQFPERLQEWLEHNDSSRPVYLTISEWTAHLMPYLRPHLLAYSLESKTGYSAQAEGVTQQYWFAHLPEWQASTDLTTREHFARLLYNHGVYLYAHGQGRFAGEYAVGAARLDSGNAPLLENCIKLLAATQRWSESLELTRTLLLLEPSNQFALTWLPRFEQTAKGRVASG
jgi:hypothetical protein